MKKFIIIALLAIICKSGFCIEKRDGTEMNRKYTIEELLKNFSKEKNTTHLKFSMSIGRIFMKGVSGVEIFSFDECDKKFKEDFNEAIKKLKDSAYETVISTNENGNCTKILLKINENFINEIMILTGGKDPAMIRIKGKIKRDDIDDIIKSNS
ncbi:MAG: DUF4252 domain-containing protein [Tannerella sp.]|jgi:hypothetical protein|nr:DUF4252 domain-containing protein [Tannerella sp.]